MITVTPKAAKRIKKVVDSKNSENEKNNLPKVIGFRLTVQAGGCSGFKYLFYPVSFPDKKFDKIFESNGVHIVVDMKSLKFVDGTEIDLTDNLLEGYIFNNPHAKTSCGCGTSFELK